MRITIWEKILLYCHRKKVWKSDQKYQRCGEVCKTYKIAQNLLKGSLIAIVSFLKVPGNLILMKNCEKYKNSQNLQKGCLTVITVFFKRLEI